MGRVNHSKAGLAARAAVDPARSYPPAEAVRLLRDNTRAKFDETVEVHLRLGVNVRHADQMVRGTTILPNGTGRSVRVAVFAQGDKAREAEEAGADLVGGAELAAQVEGGMLDFDVAVATPDMMGVVGRLGRVLGPRGLMPNPKAGTVTFDVAKAVAETKAGKVEYRTDRTGIVHLAIGKLSFDDRRILENYGSVLEEIVRAKPASSKGKYLKSVTLTSTMGPGVPLDTSLIKTGDILEGLVDAAPASEADAEPEVAEATTA